MKSSMQRLRDMRWMGNRRFPWAERIINDYVAWVEAEYPHLKGKLGKMSYAKFNGSPHVTEKKGEPWHASTIHRRHENFKGSGLSLHTYPDGTVVPSKSEFPIGHMPAATRQEVGDENAHWLDSGFTTAWVAEALEKQEQKHKEKGKEEEKEGKPKKPSKGRGSSHRQEGASSSKAEQEVSLANIYQWTMSQDTGELYRDTEYGRVYLHVDYNHEYFYDEYGQFQWVEYGQ